MLRYLFRHLFRPLYTPFDMIGLIVATRMWADGGFWHGIVFLAAWSIAGSLIAALSR